MFDSVRIAVYFFVNFDIFKWLYLACYWVYLHQTLWSLVRTLWLCESIVANLIIYRPVPSPSPFENRQLVLMWGTNHVHRNCLRLNCVSPKYNKPYLGEVCRSQPEICVLALARFHLSPSSLSHNLFLTKSRKNRPKKRKFDSQFSFFAEIHKVDCFV